MFMLSLCYFECSVVIGVFVTGPFPFSRQAKNIFVYCHMLKKIRVGRSDIIFSLILFFITELILDDILNAFLHFKSDI